MSAQDNDSGSRVDGAASSTSALKWVVIAILALLAIYGWQGNYKPGLWLLSAAALVAAAYTFWGMRSVGRPDSTR